ncbi:hypothetical protein QI633_22145 [Nocardioides sp. QY071]|uniref:hypothetical protein n=1 Tax=Nocardioides sp. QY071 TaxID=3044187 RepID=UPI00249B284D|nr:hypothetical protein [Nocardioides sp. QY071]WGY01228.1 hypothetical protein QI633_22145 [Nocardioides sp. QY071]
MIALVPGVPALLPSYASLEDPVAGLRAACLGAVAALGPRVRVVASGPTGARVAQALAAAVGSEVVAEEETGVLVVGNGSAKRTERAPGHFDERAEAFDASLRESFDGIDAALADDLWADTACLAGLPPLAEAEVTYDDAPFGVQYWVATWDVA